ncbi:alpha/beta fold hydrolase [Cupriavidus sp. WKF15]|uniref:esterase/lipase family protein n=1 Tax=Cupriavidus sp. WKF15 TaxID=3032282 RepID=UPI0023E166A2|nr:alpha/beta fold hydrolase [Cupriavidus sp. WKF15]WER44903.1 alpha/beta fold hydrolase [Cupriavidus sp. WKF15]
MTLSAAGTRRVAVILQAGTAAGIGWQLTLQAGWSWPAALLAGVVAVLAGLAAGIGLAFAMTLRGTGVAHHHRPPPAPAALGSGRLPLRLAEIIRCFANEYIAVFRMFNWLQPFCAHRRYVPPAAPFAARQMPTVLLVHGYACNHAVWLDLQPALAAAGYPCEAIDLEPVLGDLDDYADVLRRHIGQVKANTGQPPLLVCHSMGGLVARAALARAGENLGAGVVTLGTPHHGCALARFGAGRNARQMRCGSPWLTALAKAETPALRTRMVSIFSWHDSISGPPCTSWLDGAQHKALAGIGHVSLLRDPRALAAVVEALAALRTTAS